MQAVIIIISSEIDRLTLYIPSILSALLSLTPSETVVPCPGDQLLLTCSTTSTTVRWIVSHLGTGVIQTRHRNVVAASTSGTYVPTPFDINSITFNFIAETIVDSAESVDSTTLLITNLTVEGVTTDLNQTAITCLDVGSGSGSTTTVNVISPHIIQGNCNVSSRFVADDSIL